MSALSLPRPRLPIGFIAVAALFYLVDGVIVHSPVFARQPELLSAAASVDLTLGVTAAYWLMVVRPRKAAARTMLPLFIATIVAAAATLPAGHRDLLQYLRYLAMPFELAVFAAIFVGVRKANQRLAAAGAALDVPERIRAALSVDAMPARVADVVAMETSIFYYALAAWRRKPFVPDGAAAFTYHKKSGLAALLYTVAMLALVEMVAVDLVVRVHHHTAANVLLGLDVIATVWLIGFARAVQLRPIIVAGETLHVRLGPQWRADVALSNIASAEFGRVKAPRKGTPGYLRVGTQPNVLLTLREPVVARGAYGVQRSIRRIGIAVDDAHAFQAVIPSAARDPLAR